MRQNAARTARGIVLAAASTAALAACATPQEIVAQKEDNLAAAGFVVRPANTPERQGMLNRLPPNKFVQRDHGNTVSYVYADPLVCDCLYVGTQAAYGRYQQHLQAEQLADQREMTAQLYSDPSWNWGGWGGGFGPYGFGPEYGFGGGYGF